jgi:hypothetical protein
VCRCAAPLRDRAIFSQPAQLKAAAGSDPPLRQSHARRPSAFTIIGDRLPVAALIAIIYFGIVRSHRTLGIAMFILMGVLFIWTSPNRWWIGIALHYLSRVYWPDPADPIPPRL